MSIPLGSLSSHPHPFKRPSKIRNADMEMIDFTDLERHFERNDNEKIKNNNLYALEQSAEGAENRKLHIAEINRIRLSMQSLNNSTYGPDIKAATDRAMYLSHKGSSLKSQRKSKEKLNRSIFASQNNTQGPKPKDLNAFLDKQIEYLSKTGLWTEKLKKPHNRNKSENDRSFIIKCLKEDHLAVSKGLHFQDFNQTSFLGTQTANLEVPEVLREREDSFKVPKLPKESPTLSPSRHKPLNIPLAISRLMEENEEYGQAIKTIQENVRSRKNSLPNSRPQSPPRPGQPTKTSAFNQFSKTQTEVPFPPSLKPIPLKLKSKNFSIRDPLLSAHRDKQAPSEPSIHVQPSPRQVQPANSPALSPRTAEKRGEMDRPPTLIEIELQRHSPGHIRDPSFEAFGKRLYINQHIRNLNRVPLSVPFANQLFQKKASDLNKATQETQEILKKLEESQARVASRSPGMKLFGGSRLRKTNMRSQAKLAQGESATKIAAVKPFDPGMHSSTLPPPKTDFKLSLKRPVHRKSVSFQSVLNQTKLTSANKSIAKNIPPPLPSGRTGVDSVVTPPSGGMNNLSVNRQANSPDGIDDEISVMLNRNNNNIDMKDRHNGNIPRLNIVGGNMPRQRITILDNNDRNRNSDRGYNSGGKGTLGEKMFGRTRTVVEKEGNKGVPLRKRNTIMLPQDVVTKIKLFGQEGMNKKIVGKISEPIKETKGKSRESMKDRYSATKGSRSRIKDTSRYEDNYIDSDTSSVGKGAGGGYNADGTQNLLHLLNPHALILALDSLDIRKNKMPEFSIKHKAATTPPSVLASPRERPISISKPKNITLAQSKSKIAEGNPVKRRTLHPQGATTTRAGSPRQSDPSSTQRGMEILHKFCQKVQSYDAYTSAHPHHTLSRALEDAVEAFKDRFEDVDIVDIIREYFTQPESEHLMDTAEKIYRNSGIKFKKKILILTSKLGVKKGGVFTHATNNTYSFK